MPAQRRPGEDAGAEVTADLVPHGVADDRAERRARSGPQLDPVPGASTPPSTTAVSPGSTNPTKTAASPNDQQPDEHVHHRWRRRQQPGRGARSCGPILQVSPSKGVSRARARMRPVSRARISSTVWMPWWTPSRRRRHNRAWRSASSGTANWSFRRARRPGAAGGPSGSSGAGRRHRVPHRVDDEELHRGGDPAAARRGQLGSTTRCAATSRSWPACARPPGRPADTIRHLLTMTAGLPTDDPWGDRQQGLRGRVRRATRRGAALRAGRPGTASTTRTSATPSSAGSSRPRPASRSTT